MGKHHPNQPTNNTFHTELSAMKNAGARLGRWNADGKEGPGEAGAERVLFSPPQKYALVSPIEKNNKIKEKVDFWGKREKRREKKYASLVLMSLSHLPPFQL